MYLRVVIGVDPAVTHGDKSDETGIVVVAKGRDGFAYVLDDISVKGSPSQWAKNVVLAYHKYSVNEVVVEVNQGGDLVETVLKTVDSSIKVKAVRATKSKHTRASPVAMLYEQGKVFHVRPFSILEEQMCSFVPGKGKSPDRVDALVWAVTELMLEKKETCKPEVWSI